MKSYRILLSIIKNTFFQRLLNCSLLLGFAAVFFSAIFYGVDALSMLRFSYTLLFWVWGPGLLFAWLCRLRPKDNGFWTLGFAFGIIQVSCLFAFSTYFSFPLWKTFFGPLATFTFITLLFTKKSKLKEVGQSFHSVRFFWLIGMLLVGVVWSMFFLRSPSPSIVNGASIYNADFVWSVGNVEAFQRSFPPMDARISGKVFYYHHFSMLYRAAISSLSDVDSFTVCTFFYPISNILFLVFAMRFFYVSSTRRKKHIASLFFVFVVFFTACANILTNSELLYGYFFNVFFIHILMPTHGFELSLAFFVIALAILSNIPFWHRKFNQFLFLVLFLLVFSATASKGPAGLLLTISGCLLLTFILISKTFRGKAQGILPIYFFSFLAVFSGFFISYYSFLNPSGGSNTLFFSPGWLAWKSFGAGQGYSPVYAFLIPLHALGFLPFGVSGAFLWTLSVGKIRIRLAGGIVILSSALFGLGGAYFWGHVGSSNLYFIMYAVPCLNLLATDWLFQGWAKMKMLPKVFIVSIILLAAASFISSLQKLSNEGLTIASSVLKGTRMIEASRYNLSREEYDALVWIAKNSPKDALVASEKFWTSDNQTDATSGARYFYYSAFSKRQIYLEGWAYSSWAQSNITSEQQELHRRLNLLSYIFSDGEEAERIMRQENISYIIVNKIERPKFYSPYLRLCFENNRILVYSLPQLDVSE